MTKEDREFCKRMYKAFRAGAFISSENWVKWVALEAGRK